MTTLISFPLSNTPDPEPAELPRLFSIPQSRVVLQSLKQSRERWLSVFPIFSSKSRSKHPVVPASHTSKRHGTYDIRIGPHVFYRTSIFEIHYIVPTPQPTPYRPSYQYPTTSWSTSSYQPSQYVPPPLSEPAGNPLVAITPELLSRVTRAGASNPTLANLLQLAASGYASQEQLRTLGVLIQSLAASPEEGHQPMLPSHYQMQNSQRNYAYPSQVIPKPPDLVLEFPEKPSVQFIFPRGHVYCELVESETRPFRHDVLLTTYLSFNNSPAASSEAEPLNTKKMVTIRFAVVSTSLWEFIQAWAGGSSKIAASRKIFEDENNNQPQRVFLQHQLPDGPVLNQIHSTPALFPTKLIKPARSEPAGKRKRNKSTVVRKHPTTDSPHGSTKRKKTAAQSEQHGFVVNLDTPIKISCQGCGQSDVPLLNGGRCCRPCVEANKTSTDATVPAATSHSFAS